MTGLELANILIVVGVLLFLYYDYVQTAVSNTMVSIDVTTLEEPMVVKPEAGNGTGMYVISPVR